jgi:YcaO-like protein with predicted kinase domain
LISDRFSSSMTPRMNSDRLQSFFGNDTAHWLSLAQTEPAHHAAVCEFVETLSSHGIATSRPTVADTDIFQHRGFRQIIETFLQRHPSRPLPLEQITIARHITVATCRNNFHSILAELDAHRDALLRFSNAYNINIHLQLFLAGFDADLAAKLCAFVGDGAIENLVFVYNFSADTTSSLRSELAAFLDDPRSRLPGVTLAGFPFCFAPPEHFKTLFRYSLNDLKGLIGQQRQTIVKISGQPHRYLPVCSTCRCKAACYALTDIEKNPGHAPLLAAQTEDTVAFVGGSLTKPERIRNTSIVYTAPAEQGDMLAAVLAGFRNILILDGYFHTKFPCTTFEVMLALEQGLNVFGAASIGALRAVELDRFGMTGIGHVYDYLRRQKIKPYHVVAQTYRPNDTALTPPPIEIIYLLESATADNLITAADAARCLALVETISFPSLSFDYFFRRLGETGALAAPLLSDLKNYFDRNTPEHFRIKRADALALLQSFRKILATRPTGHVLKQFCRARDNDLRLLHDKYQRGEDLTLPRDWRAFSERATTRRDRRALPAAETCRLAEEFFRDLGVTVADTTGFDPPAGSFILNVFLPSLYFLGYPLASSTGNGDLFDEALASAYMELVERIPTHNFKFAAASADELADSPVPPALIPQFYNFAAAPLVKEKIARDHGSVAATDLLSGETCRVPRFAVASMFTGTDGNAAGNSLAEAILYGLYELIERDTNQIYQTDAACRDRLQHLRLDATALADPRNRALVARLEEKNYRLALYQLPNIFGIPCVRCRLFETDRELECHGSTAARANFDDAVNAALHEAHMQHISYLTGVRDDYRSFQPRRDARIAYQTAKAALFDAPACPRPDVEGHAPSWPHSANGRDGARPSELPSNSIAFATVAEELDFVVARLTSTGIKRILVANTSPLERFGVKSVKVIVPGMELWFVPEYQPSEFFADRARQTRAALEKR